MKPSYSRALIALVTSAAALIAVPAFAQNVAVVNGKPIPKAKADAVVNQLVATGNGQVKDTPELRQQVKDDLVMREVLMQEADKRGLNSDPDVIAQEDRARQQVLVGALAQDYFKKNPPTDAEVRTAYDLLVKNMSGKEYHARHILVDSEAGAKAIIAQLKKGASFQELAKQSKDPGSASNGGDLDWAPASNYVQPFADALTHLQKGQFTQTPVKTQYGYHVIKLEDVRDAKIPSFEEAKPQVTQMMMGDQRWQQAKFKVMMDDLKAKAKIE